MNKIFKLLDKKTQKSFYKVMCFQLLVIFLETFSIGFIFPILKVLTDKEYMINFLQKFLSNYDFYWILDGINYYISILILLLVVFSIKNFVLYKVTIYQTKVFTFASADFSRKLFSKYIHQSYLNYISQNSSFYIRNAIDNVNSIFGQYFKSIITITIEILTVTILGVVLLIADPLIFISVLSAFGIFGSFIYFANRTKLMKIGSGMQVAYQLRLKYLQQALGAFKEIKILNLEKIFLDKYYNQSRGIAKITLELDSRLLIPRLVLEVVGIILIFYFISLKLMSGYSLGEIIPIVGVLAFAGLRILPSINRIITSTQRIKFLKPVTKLIIDEFRKFEKNKPSDFPIKNESNIKLKKNIQLKKILFKYKSQKKFIIKELSLNVLRGDFIAIIGRSGAGKSTLINILMGLIEPLSGQIMVDGKDIKNNMRGWLKNISHTPQEVYLLDDTLSKNVAIGGDKNLIRQNMKIKKALLMCNFFNEKSSMQHNFNSIVGERGVSLSGGQKQKVGIARSLFSNKDILILDEATSSLDEKNENIILKNIKRKYKNKIVIMITHKKSVLKFANKIYSFKNAKLQKIKKTFYE